MFEQIITKIKERNTALDFANPIIKDTLNNGVTYFKEKYAYMDDEKYIFAELERYFLYDIAQKAKNNSDIYQQLYDNFKERAFANIQRKDATYPTSDQEELYKYAFNITIKNLQPDDSFHGSLMREINNRYNFFKTKQVRLNVEPKPHASVPILSPKPKVKIVNDEIINANVPTITLLNYLKQDNMSINNLEFLTLIRRVYDLLKKEYPNDIFPLEDFFGRSLLVTYTGQLTIANQQKLDNFKELLKQITEQVNPPYNKISNSVIKSIIANRHNKKFIEDYFDQKIVGTDIQKFRDNLRQITSQVSIDMAPLTALFGEDWQNGCSLAEADQAKESIQAFIQVCTPLIKQNLKINRASSQSDTANPRRAFRSGVPISHYFPDYSSVTDNETLLKIITYLKNELKYNYKVSFGAIEKYFGPNLNLKYSGPCNSEFNNNIRCFKKTITEILAKINIPLEQVDAEYLSQLIYPDGKPDVCLADFIDFTKFPANFKNAYPQNIKTIINNLPNEWQAIKETLTRLFGPNFDQHYYYPLTYAEKKIINRFINYLGNPKNNNVETVAVKMKVMAFLPMHIREKYEAGELAHFLLIFKNTLKLVDPLLVEELEDVLGTDLQRRFIARKMEQKKPIIEKFVNYVVAFLENCSKPLHELDEQEIASSKHWEIPHQKLADFFKQIPNYQVSLTDLANLKNSIRISKKLVNQMEELFGPNLDQEHIGALTIEEMNNINYFLKRTNNFAQKLQRPKPSEKVFSFNQLLNIFFSAQQLTNMSNADKRHFGHVLVLFVQKLQDKYPAECLYIHECLGVNLEKEYDILKDEKLVNDLYWLKDLIMPFLNSTDLPYNLINNQVIDDYLTYPHDKTYFTDIIKQYVDLKEPLSSTLTLLKTKYADSPNYQFLQQLFGEDLDRPYIGRLNAVYSRKVGRILKWLAEENPKTFAIISTYHVKPHLYDYFIDDTIDSSEIAVIKNKILKIKAILKQLNLLQVETVEKYYGEDCEKICTERIPNMAFHNLVKFRLAVSACLSLDEQDITYRQVAKRVNQKRGTDLVNCDFSRKYFINYFITYDMSPEEIKSIYQKVLEVCDYYKKANPVYYECITRLFGVKLDQPYDAEYSRADYDIIICLKRIIKKFLNKEMVTNVMVTDTSLFDRRSTATLQRYINSSGIDCLNDDYPVKIQKIREIMQKSCPKEVEFLNSLYGPTWNNQIQENIVHQYGSFKLNNIKKIITLLYPLSYAALVNNANYLVNILRNYREKNKKNHLSGYDVLVNHQATIDEMLEIEWIIEDLKQKDTYWSQIGSMSYFNEYVNGQNADALHTYYWWQLQNAVLRNQIAQSIKTLEGDYSFTLEMDKLIYEAMQNHQSLISIAHVNNITEDDVILSLIRNLDKYAAPDVISLVITYYPHLIMAMLSSTYFKPLMNNLTDMEKYVLYYKLASVTNKQITDASISHILGIPIDDIANYQIWLDSSLAQVINKTLKNA